MERDGIRRLVAEIKYRYARRYHRSQLEPRLIAVYRKQQSETRSVHGPVIERVHFTVGNRDIPVALGIKGLAIIDVLVRYKPSLLSAAQIERVLRTDPFSVRLGAQRLMGRRIIKVYVYRIRMRLAHALAEAGVALDSKRLLVSESTELANVKAYRLTVPCEVATR
jgi:hypothetical protein